jgi:SAM-dependent methyltransferase
MTTQGDAGLAEARVLFETALGRPLDQDAEAAIAARIAAGHFDGFALLIEVIGSSEFTNRLLARKVDAHLGLIHRARLIMVRRLLPFARDIIDLGGINSPLIDMGYRHPFRRMVMVDLAPNDRHAMYRNASFGERDASQITAHVGDMTRLDAFATASFDLAWSGQSIEHVDRDAGERMCSEVFRILVPGGRFCLDTPNRGLTSMHTKEIGGGFIHPEHKHEYEVAELRELLQRTGFEIEAAHGICEMPASRRTGHFEYEDFVLGSPIVDEPEDACSMYFAARKPAR